MRKEMDKAGVRDPQVLDKSYWIKRVGEVCQRQFTFIYFNLSLASHVFILTFNFSFSAYLYSQLGLTSLLERFTYQFFALTSHVVLVTSYYCHFSLSISRFFCNESSISTSHFPLQLLSPSPPLQLFTSYFLSPICYFPLPNFFGIPSSHFHTYLSIFY